MKALTGLSLSLLLAFGVAACAGSRTQARGLPGSETNQRISILVDNQEFNDATIYLFRNSSRYRLGIVGGKSSREFTTAWQFPEMQLQVSFLGGGGFTTERIAVSPGDDLQLIISVGSQRFGGRIR